MSMVLDLGLLSNCLGVSHYGCPSFIRVLCLGTAYLVLINPAPVSASCADDMTVIVNTNVISQIKTRQKESSCTLLNAVVFLHMTSSVVLVDAASIYTTTNEKNV